MTTSQLGRETAALTWYHTFDLGDGVVTEGMFDHRPILDVLGLPASTAGLRCLDVGTMDGYLAFEMERRGSTEVTAIDVDDVDALDWPLAQMHRRHNAWDTDKRRRFELVAGALHSQVRRCTRSVYDLDADLGRFDLVVCGDLLAHLKDPSTALERIRRVCDDRLVVYTPILASRPWVRRPLAVFDGIDEFQWWLPNLVALERMVRAAGFANGRRAEFRLPPARPGRARWRGLRGLSTGVVTPVDATR